MLFIPIQSMGSACSVLYMKKIICAISDRGTSLISIPLLFVIVSKMERVKSSYWYFSKNKGKNPIVSKEALI